MTVTNFGTVTLYNRGMRPVSPVKAILAAWGAVMGFWQTTPTVVQDSLAVAVFLYLLDTATGFMLAGMEGRARSQTLRQGAIKKAMQYFVLITVFGCAGVVLHNALTVMPAISLIIVIEFFSNIENVYKMEKGGAKMPPILRDMVQRVGRYLAVSDDALPSMIEKDKEVE